MSFKIMVVERMLRYSITGVQYSITVFYYWYTVFYEGSIKYANMISF